MDIKVGEGDTVWRFLRLEPAHNTLPYLVWATPLLSGGNAGGEAGFLDALQIGRQQLR